MVTVHTQALEKFNRVRYTESTIKEQNLNTVTYENNVSYERLRLTQDVKNSHIFQLKMFETIKILKTLTEFLFSRSFRTATIFATVASGNFHRTLVKISGILVDSITIVNFNLKKCLVVTFLKVVGLQEDGPESNILSPSI